MTRGWLHRCTWRGSQLGTRCLTVYTYRVSVSFLNKGDTLLNHIHILGDNGDNGCYRLAPLTVATRLVSHGSTLQCVVAGISEV